jgi:hypothetical protein
LHQAGRCSIDSNTTNSKKSIAATITDLRVDKGSVTVMLDYNSQVMRHNQLRQARQLQNAIIAFAAFVEIRHASAARRASCAGSSSR